MDRVQPNEATVSEVEIDVPINDAAGGAVSNRSLITPAIAVLPALALAACGGGSQSTADVPPVTPPPPPPVAITSASAGRFLAQSTMGATRAEIDGVITKGFSTWINDQFAAPRAISFWDSLVAGEYNSAANASRTGGHDPIMWKMLITSQDQLRQRVGMALLEIFVVGVEGITTSWKMMNIGNYQDILWDNAFGNFRDILEKVSTSTAMGAYLTFAYNKKANAATGSQPDENYAREIMQLFSIGLYDLNPDGTQKLVNGAPVESYTPADIAGLARVFTGWIFSSPTNTNPDRYRVPMIQQAASHELGTKVFLGTTIPANTDGVASLKIAIDTIFAHPNVPPFISKQLIQRLVTSNPSNAYVRRVSTVFANNGSGVRGDMKAVIRAILLDTEARGDSAAAASKSFGKVREPIMRLTTWARAFGANSASNAWEIGDTNPSGTRLAQSPGRSPSVFNFFRPGYTPPNTGIANDGLVAPEFQIVNEPSAIAYVNFMRNLISGLIGDVRGDYTAITTKAADSQALLDEVNILVAAGQVSAATIAQIKPAVDSIGTATPADLSNRIYTAILLVMATPEFITIK
jgi:uncharacterized protein (DUF1800 family)